MKKAKIFVLAALFLLPLTFAGFSAVMGFWGFGGSEDCNNCHNEPAAAYWNGTYASGIVIDGYANETAWEDTYRHQMEIPIGDFRGSNEQFISVVFLQSATDLYIKASWEDPIINGTGSAYDEFAICFNINAADFQAGYFSGMAAPAAGEYIDTVMWRSTEDNTQVTPINPGDTSGFGTVKTVTGTVYDKFMTSGGWNSDTTNDWTIAVTHGNQSNHNDNNYIIEMKRALTTAETTQDVQFDKSGIYEFAIAVLNGTTGIGHLVSFVHSVYVYNPSGDGGTGIPGFELIFAIFPLALLVGVTVFAGLRRKEF